jgi:branched-chain amino acid aminotransferase
MEAKRMGVFEAVLLNLDGYLTEGTTSNVFFVQRGELYTPALSCGLLEGVTRAIVLKLARRAGLKTHEGRYTLSDLRQADEIFLTSTTLEVVPVISVMSPNRIWSGRPGPVTRRLHGLFRRLV